MDLGPSAEDRQSDTEIFLADLRKVADFIRK